MYKKEIDDLARNYAYNTEHWVQRNIFKDFNLTMIKLDWNPNRRSSRGGMYASGPGINIAMRESFLKDTGEIVKFKEYNSYQHDRVIGSIYSRDPKDTLRGILLHEIAHAIQYFDYRKNDFRCKPHGPVFKKYYKALRIAILNNKLPEQKPLKQDYEEYLSKLKKLQRF